MKRKTITHAARLLCVLALAMTMTTAAFAADPPEPAQPSPCYPTAVTRSEDGLAGTLALKLDTVKVEVAGYGSSTKSVTATRTYPGLADQDTQYIPKSISDNGHSLTLQTVNWQTEGDGHFTAVASYSGSATSSYVKGYTVTADYAGTVSRINLNKIRYVAIFEGTALEPVVPEEPGDTSDPGLTDPADPTTPVDPTDAPTDAPTGEKNNVLPVVAVVVVVLLSGGTFYFIKRRR